MIKINVAKKEYNNYYHREMTRYLFCCEFQTIHDARRALLEIMDKFPSPDYLIELTRWESMGYSVELNDFITTEQY